MDAIKNIKTRISHSKLIKPHPTQEEMKIIYESALGAADHARYTIIPKKSYYDLFKNLKASNFRNI